MHHLLPCRSLHLINGDSDTSLAMSDQHVKNNERAHVCSVMTEENSAESRIISEEKQV